MTGPDKYSATGGVDETVYAFPSGVPHAGNTWASDMGMTLRDYFAAKAMPALMTDYWNSDTFSDPTWTSVAKDAYLLADAMMKAREK